MRARHKQGSVVFNRRSKTWHYLWVENGRRRSKIIGTRLDYPTKTLAWQRAEDLRATINAQRQVVPGEMVVKELAEQYEREKLPTRENTARVYRSWLHNHVLPYWGNRRVTEIQPRETELWLQHLPLSPKSRSHVRNMMRTLVDFGMWSGALQIARNPMDLVRVKGATKRIRSPRSLRIEEFQALSQHLREPFRTMALLAVCFGLRVSELLALRWSDIDWDGQTLTVERRIVAQKLDQVKTAGSGRRFTVHHGLLLVLKQWRAKTQFGDSGDWVFASPLQLGRLPYSDSGFWRVLNEASAKAGIGRIGTHTFRHTHRAWLDAVGTPITIQQKMMRHADIRTTMNIYGDVITDEMAQAHSKVVSLALNRPN